MRPVRRTALAVVVLVSLVTAVPAQAEPGTLTLVSRNATDDANATASQPALSADGSVVAFHSSATNLDPADTTGFLDVYVRDTAAGTLSLASTSTAGEKGNRSSFGPSISADGTIVAFTSDSTNLASGDQEIFQDVYVKNLLTQATTLVSVSEDGTNRDGNSSDPSLSADGSRVAFASHSALLDPNDPDTAADIYVYDFTTGELVLASTTSDGTKANVTSRRPVLSGDGTRVAFYTDANNLSDADTDALTDVYVKDLTTGALTLVTTSETGEKSNGNSATGSLSEDGTLVAFSSDATNLDSNDTDTLNDVFVKDLTTGAVTVASASGTGTKGNSHSFDPSLAADGSRLAFYSESTNLHADDDAEGAQDVFVKDLVTHELMLASASDAGTKGNGNSAFPELSDDGTVAGFSTSSTNFDPLDTDVAEDVYVKELPESAAVADLSLLKRSTASNVQEGGSFQYGFRVTNAGPATATGVVLTDDLPEQVSFVSATPGRGTCGHSAGVVTCQLGPIAPGGLVQVSVQVTASQAGSAVNSASVTGNENDPTSPNEATTTTTIHPASTGFALTVTKSGGGSVRSDPAGISCGTDCSQSYGAGTVVRLTARPRSGWTFSSWGGDCSGTTGRTCTVTMDAARTASASFVRLS